MYDARQNKTPDIRQEIIEEQQCHKKHQASQVALSPSSRYQPSKKSKSPPKTTSQQKDFINLSTIGKAKREERIAARSQKRASSLKYTPEALGQENWDRIIRYYNNGIPLASIVSKVNASIQFGGGGTCAGVATDEESGSIFQGINLADCYMTIFFAMRGKKEDKEKPEVIKPHQTAKHQQPKQRRKHLSFELEINTFAVLYRAWLKGQTPKEIQELASSIPRCSRVGVDRLLRSLRLRTQSELEITEVKAKISAMKILEAGHVMQLPNPSNNTTRTALVIFIDELPAGALEFITQKQEPQSTGDTDEFATPSTEKFPVETFQSIPEELPSEILTAPIKTEFGHTAHLNCGQAHHKQTVQAFSQSVEEKAELHEAEDQYLEELETTILPELEAAIPEASNPESLPPADSPPEPSVSEQLSGILT